LNFHLFNLNWFYTAIAWVMKEWHALFSTFLDPAGGITWALSIVFLVVTVRIVLFRFFIKQVKSQRAMQEIQPEIQKLKKQFGSDRQGFSQAVMALQKERGVNPLAGCLPIIPQIPVFISLLHVLRRLAPGEKGLYSWDDTLTNQAAVAKLFGAPISSSFNMTGAKATEILRIASYTNIRIVAMALIVIMCVTTFYTQKQIQRRSGPVEGQAATVQRLLLYGMPLSLFVSGFFFPIGVLLYWFTNNLWTLGQQFYILKKLPIPGAPGAQGKGGDKPAVDPKALAPRPGAKPVRNRPSRPANQATGTRGQDGAPATDAPATDSPAESATPTSPGEPGPVLNGVPLEKGDSSGKAAGKAPGSPTGSAPGRGVTKSGQGPGNRPKRKRR
jgi:YidC/Oxa1 family membrane protein insertase